MPIISRSFCFYSYNSSLQKGATVREITGEPFGIWLLLVTVLKLSTKKRDQISD